MAHTNTTMSTHVAAHPSKRILSIDILRGIVMVIMVLDHARDYFSGFPADPTDLQHTTTLMFFTRWITHFCAPVFIFLSGTSVLLSMGGKGGRKKAAWRLLTRGLWFIFLELTIIRFGWLFNLDYSFIVFQVIWAIGWSMIFLSALIFLPMPAILTIGLIMVSGHNLLDGVPPPGGAMGTLWQVLHIQSPIHYGPGNSHMIFVIYPLIPWVGVMALGYCFGAIIRQPVASRNRSLYVLGGGMVLLFILLRYSNLYGDPSPWQPQSSAWFTVLSFINCTKYPPSLLYLLMTLGPAIFAMPLLERTTGPVGRFFSVYGWVPFFFYVLHIYLLHSMALVAQTVLHSPTTTTVFTHPAYPIAVVYGCWLGAVLLLYLPCRWFMRVKMRDKRWWLSYL